MGTLFTFFPIIALTGLAAFGMTVSSDTRAAGGADTSHGARVEIVLGSKLDALVAGGDLTEAQKQAILTERDKLRTQAQANFDLTKSAEWQTMTPDERQAQLDLRVRTDHQALLERAVENRIDTKYLYLVGGFGGGFGHGVSSDTTVHADA